MWGVIVLLCALRVASGSSWSESNSPRFPRLFNADDYGLCLARPGALYCMGSFRLTPSVTPHHIYDVLRKHSSNMYSFDRTLLHRGYCVTMRCADAHFNGTSLADKAKWFEMCVQNWTRPLKMTAHLETLQYCRGPEDRLLEIKEAQEDHSTHQLFLKITFSLLLMNVVGTVYDLMIVKNNKAHKLLLAWSVRNNWNNLVERNPDGKAYFKPLQGYRVLSLLGVLLGHSVFIHHLVYTKNHQYLEYMSSHPIVMMFKNGSAVTQLFILVSSFLLGHSMLNSKQKPLGFTYLTKTIIKRIARISPVYFYVLLFTISWWPLLLDGSMWQLVVRRENDICKRKFWAHIFYINNYVEKDSHCLIQTWSLAVDMQLYIFAAIVTHAIAQFKVKPLPILGTMFVTSCVLNAVVAYIFEWKPFVLISSPDDLRTMLKDQNSFSGTYTSTWGSLPACILGLYVAHKHYSDEIEGKKIQHSKFFYLIDTMAFIWWTVGYFTAINNRLLNALWIGLDRPVFSLLVAVKMYGICKKNDSPESRLMSWHGFCVLGRLSLSMVMLHWSICLLFVAASSTVVHTSTFQMITDTVGTWVLTYLLAVPVTLLVEMPVSRSISTVI